MKEFFHYCALIYFWQCFSSPGSIVCTSIVLGQNAVYVHGSVLLSINIEANGITSSLF